MGKNKREESEFSQGNSWFRVENKREIRAMEP